MFASVALASRIDASEVALTLQVGRSIARRHPDTLTAEIAVITTRPGSKSQENAMKSGFALLYVRAVLLKPAP